MVKNIDLNVVGKRFPGALSLEKVTGYLKYPSDISFPNMLYGAVLRSPFPHAKIIKIDTSKAEKIVGVKSIITHKDISPKYYMGFNILDQPILVKEKVRFVGDPIVAVAAIDEDTANEGLESIHIEYEELPTVFDAEIALLPESPKIHGSKTNIAAVRRIVKGDVEEGFTKSDFVFEDVFRTYGQEHAPLEPEANVVVYEPNGKFTCFLSSHNLFVMRYEISKALGIPEKNINVKVAILGGSYGGKSRAHLGMICAALAKKAGPGSTVKLTHSRKDEFTCSTIRHPFILSLKTGVRKDGKIVARYCKCIANMGAYVSSGDFVVQWAGNLWSSCYKSEHVLFEGLSVYTNLPIGGAFRGFGNPQNNFAQESQMDIIANKLGIDPIELRIKNAVQKGYVMANGWKLKSCGLKECIQNVKIHSNSNNWNKEKYSIDQNIRRGIGFSCGVHGSGWKPGFENRIGLSDTDGSQCLIMMEGDGIARVYTGELDYGQGASVVMAQIVAEQIGINFEDVSVTYGDTDLVPYNKGPYSSRTTFVGGKAAQLAALDVKRQLLKYAAKILDTNIDDLKIINGVISSISLPDKLVSVADTALYAYSRHGGQNIIGKGYFDHKATVPDPQTGQGSISGAFLFFAQSAEVEVNLKTGKIKVLRIVSAHDLGKAINPMLAEGQIQGGVVQGLGYALTEKLEWVNGITLNPNFREYKIFTSLDIPDIEAVLVETEEPDGPYGAKGVGEPAATATGAAIANAVANAVGVRIKELPITSVKVLKCLNSQQ